MDADASAQTAVAARPSGSWPARILKWAAIALAALILLAGALLLGINSDPGRRWVAGQINGMEMASGLSIHVDGLEGSLYGKLRVRGLTLSDPKGVFFSSPLVSLDWRPFAYLNNHVDIRSAAIPQARLRRLPELKPSGDPNAPLLPDLDIDIGRLQIGRLQVDPAVTGTGHLLALDARATIADRRAQIRGDVRALTAPGIAGGDRLHLVLDAVPADNRLAVDVDLSAPKGGFITSLAGLNQPVSGSISGKGSWKDWRGGAQLNLGAERLLDLSITARNGTFAANGPIRPGLLFDGPVRRLAAPFVQLNLVTTLDQRRADTRVQLRSKAAALAASGQIDLGHSRFTNLKLAARLLEPGAIAPNLRASNARVALVLNGPFGTPQVAYRLQAAAVGFGDTIVQGLDAQGSARIDTDRILIPVAASATRIGGLNPALGGLLTNVRLNGSFAISGSHMLSDNLRIRSDRLNATAIVVADLAKGEYRGAIKGTVNNYLVEGIGLLDVTTNLDLTSSAAGFGLNGRIAVRTRRIDNATARDFLGGNAIVTAHLAMNAAGVFSLDNLRVASPQLTISSGRGHYGPGSEIGLNATGISKA
jgi:translocation and assembly module TamB